MLQIPQACRAAARKFRPNGDYAAEIEADFAQIEPYLPSVVSTILDIGCGLAGIDVFLKRKFPSARLSLLDSDGDDPWYGWCETNGPYGSRKLAEEVLAANGVEADEWLPGSTKAKLKADLVISLVAWGFHFPLKTYDVEGYCIADLRTRHEPVRGVVIAQNGKVARCAFQC